MGRRGAIAGEHPGDDAPARPGLDRAAPRDNRRAVFVGGNGDVLAFILMRGAGIAGCDKNAFYF